MLKRIVHTVLFLVGLLGTALWIRSFESLPFWSWSKDKLSFYAANADQYDTLLLGSSRINFGIVPAVFDARTRELGKPTKTFNLGLSGLRPHDVDVMLDWVLEHRSPNLRRVCIELHSWGQEGRWDSWMTDKRIEMHPPSHWWTRTKSALSDSVVDLFEKARVVHSIATHTLVNTFRIGRAPAILDGWIIRLRGAGRETRTALPGDGFVDVAVAASPQHREQHEAWVASPERFKLGAAGLRQGEHLRAAPGSFDLESARRQVHRVRAAGLDLMFVVMPSLVADFYGRAQVSEIDPDVLVVELDQPSVCEPLLRPEFWYDHAHVTQAGAELLSRLFAEVLLGPRLPPYVAPPRLPAPVPVSVPSQLLSLSATAVWSDEGMDLRVESVPEGDVLAVVSTAPADQDLGNGLRARVALPPLTYASLAREGAGARGRIEGANLPDSAPLYVQFAVLRGHTWVAVSDRIDVPARR